MLKIADKEFSSRLFTGTGKFNSSKLMEEALIASGSELVTVALRRVDMNNAGRRYFITSQTSDNQSYYQIHPASERPKKQFLQHNWQEKLWKQTG